MSEHEWAEPVDLDRLLFVDVDGVRHLGMPNRDEEQLAAALARDVVILGAMVAAPALAMALAAVREGSTLPGPRSVVRAELHLIGRAWRDPDARRQAERAVRRKWFDELERHGHRPVGWPVIEVTRYGYSSEWALSLIGPDDRHPGFVRLPADTPDAEVDLACLEVRSATVPA